MTTKYAGGFAAPLSGPLCPMSIRTPACTRTCMPRNCHFVNVHHACLEGLLLAERENRESFLLIGARSCPHKKTGVKRMHRKRSETGKKMEGVGDVRGGEGQSLPVALVTASLVGYEKFVSRGLSSRLWR